MGGMLFGYIALALSEATVRLYGAELEQANATIHEKLGFHQLELPHRAGLGVELEDNQHQFACLLNLG